MNQALNAFLLGFPALFSIVNPISGAFIFRSVTAGRRHDRAGLARQVALYSLAVMTAALWWFFLGMTAATVALAAMIWITYRSADRISRLMGPRGSRTVTRLSAFLLLCIGVQILITGVEDVLGPLLAQR